MGLLAAPPARRKRYECQVKYSQGELMTGDWLAKPATPVLSWT